MKNESYDPTTSDCCGANRDEDIGICYDCKEHCDGVMFEDLYRFPNKWMCKYCGSISHDDNITPADGFCYFHPAGVGNHTFRRVEADGSEAAMYVLPNGMLTETPYTPDPIANAVGKVMAATALLCLIAFYAGVASGGY